MYVNGAKQIIVVSVSGQHAAVVRHLKLRNLHINIQR